MIASKTLWTVDLNSADEEDAFFRIALAAGATSVAIRTTTPSLPALIGRFHERGLRVYGWRWPAVTPKPKNKRPHYFALDEALHVTGILIPAGLDGYIVNPESEKAGADNDWNRDDLAPLARTFCSAILSRAATCGHPFLFGITSGCIYPSPTGRPDIPWDTFFSASDVLLPQTYWRRRLADGTMLDLSGGSPRAAIDRGMAAWTKRAGGRAIVPMAGELEAVTGAEIAEYGALLGTFGVTAAHFYAESAHIDPTVLAAIRAL